MGGGPSQTTNQAASTDPWSGQQPYLLDAFKQAQGAYDKNIAQGAYSGDYVAAPSTQQYDAYGNAVTQGYNQQGYNNGMLAGAAQNSQTGAAGVGGAMGALSAAGGDQTQSNIAKAQAYASGLDIDGAVNAGMYQANRNAAESNIPNIYRGAAASGGVNSDRAALSQGVVERGLAEQSAALRSTLANSAYTTGLANAQQGNQTSNAANSAYGSLGSGLLNAGLNGQNSAIGNQANLNAQISGGANGATGLDQQTLNNLMQKYNGGQQFTTQQLQNLMSIVGSKSWGSQTTGSSTTETTPSMLQNIGSGVGVAAALFCDRGIKHVYGRTGGSWRGFPEYIFSYRDDVSGRLHKGPMAQDVEQTHPHAVTSIGGVKVILTDRI